MSKESNSRPGTAHIPPFGLRLQPELRERLQTSASKNGRSLNAEITNRLESSLRKDASWARGGYPSERERLEFLSFFYEVFKDTSQDFHAELAARLAAAIEKKGLSSSDAPDMAEKLADILKYRSID